MQDINSALSKWSVLEYSLDQERVVQGNASKRSRLRFVNHILVKNEVVFNFFLTNPTLYKAPLDSIVKVDPDY